MSNITLGNRLSLCMSFVSEGGKTVDVGTDHAYLPICLINENISKTAIACDINDGPVMAAKLHIEMAGLEDRIEVIKSDGLDEISPFGVTDVVIAGMGGDLISDILSRAEWVKDNVNLVLQPMTKPEKLRQFLYENGFEIVAEKACEEEGFLYSVIKAKFSGVNKTISRFESIVGGLDFSDKENEKYLLKIAERLEISGKGMLKNSEVRENGLKNLEMSEKIRRELGKL